MSRAQTLIDTGPIVAILDPREEHHAACVDVLRNLGESPCTCWPVITEAMWLLRGSHIGQKKLLESLETGVMRLLPLDETSVPKLELLLDQYASLRPQIADLCLVHLADRESIQTVFTLDRRDFSVYRYRGRGAFRLLPEP